MFSLFGSPDFASDTLYFFVLSFFSDTHKQPHAPHAPHAERPHAGRDVRLIRPRQLVEGFWLRKVSDVHALAEGERRSGRSPTGRLFFGGFPFFQLLKRRLLKIVPFGFQGNAFHYKFVFFCFRFSRGRQTAQMEALETPKTRVEKLAGGTGQR